MNKFSKVTWYKANTQKSVAILQNDYEQFKKEIRKIISCTTALKRRKYLEINLHKDMNDLYNEKYNFLYKKLRKTTTWNYIPCSWIGRQYR